MADGAAPLDHATAAALAGATLSDPFAVLGPHDGIVRAFLPGACAVEAVTETGTVELAGLKPPGLFAGPVTGPYRLRIRWPGAVQEAEDPYAFGPLLGDLDLHLIGEGRHFDLAHALGSRPMSIGGVPGVRFAVWAPNAARVAVVGDFNAWDGRRHGMRLRHGSGVWEIFVPRLAAGERYKYAITARDGRPLPLKADPLATRSEPPPATASIVDGGGTHAWTDRDWMAGRAARQAPDAPISIYEFHAPSWLAGLDAPSWDALARHLVPHVRGLGFTHVELLPVAEHPFGGSWGYQPLALFAPTARLGEPDGLRRFVDACHGAGIGVIVDWVPAHFPTDPHGLVRFDGTALYEHEDPRQGFHQDWNTLIYNFGRDEVQGLLIASAVHWLEQFHLDGLRVDAVASMLYRDYSRRADEWVPNIHGGRENLEAIGFLRHLNAVVAERCPGAIMIAEESTAWPGVTRPIAEGGLGFSYKWNMGWMHDTLHYMARDPVHRGFHHDEMTFGLVYAFSERFLLPLSHDEVVHGKGSLLGRMPGDRWQRFANLRAYYAFMWAHPGKKLVFMGAEHAQEREWDHDAALDRHLARDPLHGGVGRLLADLNRLYREHAGLHRRDGSPDGFRWVVGDDRANSVFAFLRLAEDARPVLAICNMTPVPRHGYRVGAPAAGTWREILNTDAQAYGGSGAGNQGGARTEPVAAHGYGDSLVLTLPPLAALYLVAVGD
ncbi:1,4-alpha-glucan branching protein GlgB [Stella sp.]|uniref:1,4-alpha-glucan branching protein GlgB n=1 Tax=Stella sp. TaxID=2912054 RepID=UPI0035AE297B